MLVEHFGGNVKFHILEQNNLLFENIAQIESLKHFVFVFLYAFIFAFYVFVLIIVITS